jgi:nucleoside 2-deoxyribosyltransferase
LEIGYAVALGKPIYALSGDSKELCRHVLFREIISSPSELVKKLK